MLSLLQLTDLVNDRLEGYSKKHVRYEKWRSVYYGMSLHIDGICPSFKLPNGAWYRPVGWNFDVWNNYDAIFNFLILNQYPNEADDTRNWRLSQYKPFTRAPFMQCIQVITGAIFQDSGYSIIINNQKDSDYIWDNNFDGKSLPQYISDNFPSIVEDPNGLFVVVPETENGDIEPDVWFVFSRDIIHKSEDEVVFYREGYKWVVNKLGYFRYRQIDGKGDFVMTETGGYYAHMLDYVPAYCAGGIWNNQGFFSSWFENAKPLADEYASAYSAEQLVYRDASYPIVIEAMPDCPDCAALGTFQFCYTCHKDAVECVCDNEGLNWGLKACQTCGGSKKIARNPGQRMQAPMEQMDKDLVKIVNFNTDILSLHTKKNVDMFNQIFRSLYLNYIEVAQSGVAKDKDMEARYQFVLRISNDLFDRLITGIITTILSLRNVRVVGNENKPDAGDFVIIKPTQFQVKTAYDLSEDYKVATESKLPDFVRSEIMKDYTDKQFGGDKYLQKKTEVIKQLDIFSVTDPDNIQIALLNGAATTRDYQYHIRLPMLLDKLKRDKGTEWVLDASIDIIEAAVKSLFDAIAPPPLAIDYNAASVQDKVIT